MPRVRKPRPERASSGADSLAAFASSAPKKSPPATGLARQLRETKVMMDTGNWKGAKASHLVAMYSILHELVYEVAPDIRGDELKQAKYAAGSFLKGKCDGEFIRAVDFMRWVWSREREREQWRRDNCFDGKVLGWRLILRHPSMFTEYRIGQERRKHG